MAGETLRQSDTFAYIWNATSVSDASEYATEVTITPNLSTNQRRNIGKGFTKNLGLYTDYGVDLGTVEYNEESKKFVAMQDGEFGFAVGQVGKWVVFGGGTTEGVPIEPQADDIALYNVSVMQDGLLCSGAGVKSAVAFSFSGSSRSVTLTVPAGSYGNTTEAVVIITDGPSNVSTGTLAITKPSGSADSVTGIDMTVGGRQITLDAGFQANLAGATEVVLSLATNPSATVTGVLVLANRRED